MHVRLQSFVRVSDWQQLLKKGREYVTVLLALCQTKIQMCWCKHINCWNLFWWNWAKGSSTVFCSV